MVCNRWCLGAKCPLWSYVCCVCMVVYVCECFSPVWTMHEFYVYARYFVQHFVTRLKGRSIIKVWLIYLQNRWWEAMQLHCNCTKHSHLFVSLRFFSLDSVMRLNKVLGVPLSEKCDIFWLTMQCFKVSVYSKTSF